MEIKSVEFVTSFVNSLHGVGESETNRITDSISLEVAEGTIDPAAPLAEDNGIVGRVIVRLEDGALAAFALKSNSD